MNQASILGPRERLRRLLVEALMDAAGPDAEASKRWCEAMELDREEYRLMTANRATEEKSLRPTVKELS